MFLLPPEKRNSLKYSGCREGAYSPGTANADYGGAHADGYDYADCIGPALSWWDSDEMHQWSEQVCQSVGTPEEGWLYIVAAGDYRAYAVRCEDADETPLPKGKWCAHHVAGQIDRALEHRDHIWDMKYAGRGPFIR